MKQKELKNLANQIAECELIIENNSEDDKAVAAAQLKIMQLTNKVHDFQDLDLIDELVQEYIQRNS